MNFGTRLITRYIAAIRWFIPLEVREDAATLTRAQNVMNAAVMAALSGPLYAFTYHALGYSAAARVILTCCAGMFVAPFLMRLTKSIVVAREVFLCAVFFNFSWLTYAMGGVSAPTAGWMVVPPMVALFLGGFATAMFWLGLTCATVVLIHALPLLGIPLPTHPIEDMALLYLLCDVGLYIVIVLFVILFELTRTQGVVKLQQALDFMHGLATGDDLTGACKRRRTLKLAEEERSNSAARGTPFSLCLLDIDGFRRINADHGQAAGDLVLREVALCVKRHARELDAFGRYGAAQLLLILPHTTQEEAQLLADRVREDVSRLRFAGIAPELAVTVSIGAAQYRQGESIGQTMARADEALDQAASKGRELVAGGLFDSTRIDALTGLLGRRVLRDRLGHAMARALRNARPVGVMLLNLDRFKDINDAFGIEGGDEVLVQAARRVRSCLHVADTIVRFSGDQFIVILEDLDSAGDTRQAAQKILDQFAFPLAVGERDCAVGVSIGIALFPAPSCDMDTLLARADAAMVRARNLGGNRFQVHAPDAATAPDEGLDLANDLRQAVAANALQLAYQPRVDLATGLVAGVEARLHWRHPRHGRLEAARFMPLAEESGLAVPIGEWTLRSACLQNAAWHAAGLPAVRIALKLSARQLEHPGMAERILAIVGETGIDPRCLELGVDEGMLADDSALVNAVLARLRRAGVRIAIDGFGLGAAGLGYLTGFAADSLTLDRSFVERLGQHQRDERAGRLAASIVHLAQRLQMTVVADAVATNAQLAGLRAMGCDWAQGEAVGRAAGPGEIAQLLAGQTAECPT